MISCGFLAACKGADGAIGPDGAQGIPGPTGPAGVGTRLTLTGTLDANGVASRTLPAAAGNKDNLPLMACYQLIGNIWTTEAAGGHSCVIGNTVAPLNVAMVNGRASAPYAFVIVY
jgi:hypothetical protein